MSVTSGFFNSLNGDRKYNAEQMSALFDGLINDGIYASIGTAFTVKAGSGNSVSIGIGRGWFNSTWIYNDSILLLQLEESELLLGRIDAIVIDINHNDNVREGSIKVVKGIASSNPMRPSLIRDNAHNQYPLAYVNRPAGSSSISQADITSMIGTSSCPYVTGIVQVQNIDNIVAQWQAQWDRWYTQETQAGNNQLAQWMSAKQLEFNNWFGNLQTILDGDVATKIAQDILELQERIKILVREYAIYDTVCDRSGNEIEDSYGTVVTGKIVYRIAE